MSSIDPSLEFEHEAGQRLLLVDHDRQHLESLTHLLGPHELQIDTASGGNEALCKLGRFDYDLMLLDLGMPDVSGLEVLSQLAERGTKTLTIVVSGSNSFEDVGHVLRKGAYDYIKKPYAPEQLIATINNALLKQRLERSNRMMQNQLKVSERLHRFIVDSSQDIIFILDEQSRFSFLNSTVETLLGYTRNELIGLHFSAIVEGEDQDKAAYYLTHVANPPNDPRLTEISLKPKQEGRIKRCFELSSWPIGKIEGMPEKSRQYCFFGTARDITERNEAEALINFQAYHDLLTRLPNRSLFRDRLSSVMMQAARQQLRPAVMFIDLDRFKIINDTLGHTMGDRLLQAVSQRLQACIRKSDTLSRFGGDEFTLLLPDVANDQMAIQVAEKILEGIRKPFHIQGNEIFVGASIGIAVYPEGGTTLDALLKNADLAMYQVKSTGKDGFRLFTSDMSENAMRRLMLEQDLRRALSQGEMEIHYQQQMDLKSGQLVGMEALIRWNHPKLGQLPPAEFIPIAEECGLIAELDQHTLRRACRQMLTYHAKGFPNLQLSVNFSPLLLERDGFVDQILSTLAGEKFPPHLLVLEITESVLLKQRPEITEKLLRLCQANIKLAIDDFGTGYSSIAYLTKFPIHTIKIDHSFIHMIRERNDDACIVNAMVSMAQGLKIKIVAEGVENEVQLEYLKALGCDVVQGYLVSPPSPLSQSDD